MMPLDARFTPLAPLAGEARAPDEGDAARSGAGNPFAGLLDEIGRGTGPATSAGSEEPADPRAPDDVHAAPRSNADAPPAAGSGAVDGADGLSRLIAQVLARTGVAERASAQPSPLEAEGAAASQPDARAQRAEGAPGLARMLAAAQPQEARAPEERSTGQEAAEAPAPSPEPEQEQVMSGAENNSAAGLGPAGMATLLASVSPQPAPPHSQAQPNDPHAEPQKAPTQVSGPQGPAPQEDAPQEAPRLVAKVIDVQTHFAPIRSLTGDGLRETDGAARPAGAAPAPMRPQADWTGSEDAFARNPTPPANDAQTTDGLGEPLTSAEEPKARAGAPKAQPAPRDETGNIQGAGRAPASASSAPAAATASPLDEKPVSAPIMPAPPPRAVPRAIASSSGPAPAFPPDATDPFGPATALESAPLAAALGSDRPARRADAATPAPSGAAKAAEAAPGTRPSEDIVASRATDEHPRGRQEARDERAAPAPAAPADTPAGRTGSGGSGPVTGSAPAFPAPAASAVAGAISEAARHLVRTNAGADLSAAPRPGDPVRIMEIALTPEGLGKVTVRLRLTSEGLEVRVRASDANTAALLQQDKAQLAGILREFGCSEDRMEVSGPDGGAIGATTGPDLRSAQASSGDDRRGDPQGDRSNGGSQDGSRRNEGRHDDQGSRNPPRGGPRDSGFDAGLDGGLLDG